MCNAGLNDQTGPEAKKHLVDFFCRLTVEDSLLCLLVIGHLEQTNNLAEDRRICLRVYHK